MNMRATKTEINAADNLPTLSGFMRDLNSRQQYKSSVSNPLSAINYLMLQIINFSTRHTEAMKGTYLDI